MKEYTIVESINDCRALVSDVELLLGTGRQLHGPLTVNDILWPEKAGGGVQTRYYQAMVK